MDQQSLSAWDFQYKETMIIGQMEQFCDFLELLRHYAVMKTKTIEPETIHLELRYWQGLFAFVVYDSIENRAVVGGRWGGTQVVWGDFPKNTDAYELIASMDFVEDYEPIRVYGKLSISHILGNRIGQEALPEPPIQLHQSPDHSQ